MKTYFNTTLLFLFVFSIKGFSQIKFEKGYFINNQGEQINCLIKNVDWKNNPIDFEYKLTENSEIKKEAIKTVAEFGVDGISKYVKTNVKIDHSSTNLSDLSKKRKPDFIEEVLFLKVLTEGDANLYRYTKNNLTRYFYKLKSSKIEQLVYKMYEVKSEGDLYYVENEMYKQQLFSDVNCQANSIHKYKMLLYKQKSLIKVFVNHNKCKGGVVASHTSETKEGVFNLRVRPGINFSSLKLENSSLSKRNIDFGSKINFRLGIEFEYVLPFNKDKWSLFVEPTYQYCKVKKDNVYYSNLRTQDVEADYKSIELPFGLKHKFFIGDKVNVFLKAAYVFDFQLKSKISHEISGDLDIDSSDNLTFGLGGEFVNKFSLEYRFGTRKSLLRAESLDARYNTSSIILGYKLF